jgi:hypothetical protein
MVAIARIGLPGQNRSAELTPKPTPTPKTHQHISTSAHQHIILPVTFTKNFVQSTK